MVASYFPSTYGEALELLAERSLTIIAGGTDLMVKRRSWSDLPTQFDSDVLFLSGIEELNYIDRRGGNIHIGAGVTLEDLMDHFHTPKLLSEAIKIMASPAIRHSATLAGNIVNASPAGDSLPVLYVLEGVVVAESQKGIRHIPIEAFIKGPGKTDLQRDELIKEIIISDHHFNHTLYKKVGGRKADAISKVSFCGVADVKKNIVEDIKIAFGAVGPTVVRVKDIEDKIKGQSIDWLNQHLDTIHDFYEPFIRPIDDQRSSAVYRKTCAMNLLHGYLKHL
jgi:CO/xanthine dehydrogenase FAD-binding subunit